MVYRYIFYKHTLQDIGWFIDEVFLLLVRAFVLFVPMYHPMSLKCLLKYGNTKPANHPINRVAIAAPKNTFHISITLCPYLIDDIS